VDAGDAGVTDQQRVLEVVEYTDPLCPWAWGSEPTFRRMREVLGPEVRWRRVFGILFDTDDDPPPDPDAETAWYHRNLAVTGTAKARAARSAVSGFLHEDGTT
jgi:protein-disulfide isomerase-like protein with CxxC motif